MTTPKPSSRIMVLIPCYQEEANIGRLAAASNALRFDTIVVDDGSTDNTVEQAKKNGATVLHHTVNQGKGAAVKTGLQYALERNYGAVVLLDGDGQHLPSEIQRFIDVFETSHPDFIIGTRMFDTKKMPFVRRQTNRVMSCLLSRQMGRRISDTQCGFRLFSKTAIPVAIACISGGFSAESEILLQLALHGYSIAEVEISTIYGNEKSKIRPIRDTFRFLKMLIHFRKNRPTISGHPQKG